MRKKKTVLSSKQKLASELSTFIKFAISSWNFQILIEKAVEQFCWKNNDRHLRFSWSPFQISKRSQHNINPFRFFKKLVLRASTTSTTTRASATTQLDCCTHQTGFLVAGCQVSIDKGGPKPKNIFWKCPIGWGNFTLGQKLFQFERKKVYFGSKIFSWALILNLKIAEMKLESARLWRRRRSRRRRRRQCQRIGGSRSHTHGMGSTDATLSPAYERESEIEHSPQHTLGIHALIWKKYVCMAAFERSSNLLWNMARNGGMAKFL